MREVAVGVYPDNIIKLRHKTVYRAKGASLSHSTLEGDWSIYMSIDLYALCGVFVHHWNAFYESSIKRIATLGGQEVCVLGPIKDLLEVQTPYT